MTMSILPFSPEDDLTSVTPIVYHVSITETGDVETFIKRIKLALRKVMEEQNDVSFQVKDNGVTRLDIFTKHKATYAQIIYPKGNTIGLSIRSSEEKSSLPRLNSTRIP